MNPIYSVHYLIYYFLLFSVVYGQICSLTTQVKTDTEISTNCTLSTLTVGDGSEVTLYLTNSAVLNITNSILLYDFSQLNIASSSQVFVGTLQLKGNSVCLMEDTTIFKCSKYIYLFGTSQLLLNKKALYESTGTTYFRENSKLSMSNNSNFMSQGIIYFYSNSSFLIVNDARLVSMKTVNFIENSTLVMKDNTFLILIENINFKNDSKIIIWGRAQITCSKTIFLNQKSILQVNENGSITTDTINSTDMAQIVIKNNAQVTTQSNITLNGRTSFSIIDNTMVVVINILIKENSVVNMKDSSKLYSYSSIEITSGTFSITDNSFLNATKIDISNNGKLIINKSNTIEEFPIVLCSLFVCSQGIVNITLDSIIHVDTSTNMNNCNFLLTNRTIRDFPLFFVNTFNLADNNYVTNNWNFDLVYSKTPIVGASQTNLLLDGHLYRNGNSKKIFCHLNQFDSKTNTMGYTEPYCPCEDKEDWYITPFANITFLKITVDSTKNDKNKNIKKVDDDFTDESTTIGNTQISFYKTDNVIVQITSKLLVEIESNSLTKKVLFISESKLVYGNVKYNAALNTKNGIKIISGVECGNGLYNKSSQQCHILNDCDVSNCKYCPNDRSVCEKCQSTYKLIDGNCIKNENCLFSTSNWCKKCLNGFYMKNGNCEKVTDCNVIKIDGTCQICENNNKKMLNLNGECIESDKTKVETTSNTNIITCKNGYFLSMNTCEKCVDSALCENGRVIKCDTNNEMSINGNCEIPNDTNGRCNKEIINCIVLTNAKCGECDNNFILSQNKCENSRDIHCEVQNSFGCIKCQDTYYYDESTKLCESCDPSCLTCFETATKCLSCPQNMYLSDYKCNTNNDLKMTCDQFASFGSGCVVCKDGYYRVGLDCLKCDIKCGTCLNLNSCLACNSTNYKTNDGECLLQSDIFGCAVNVTQSGCSKCQDGYYIVNTNECRKCDDNCNTCTSTSTKCTSCGILFVLLTNGSCVNYSKIMKCKETTQSKCSKCSFWYVPNEDGMSCKSRAVWWVILVAVLFVIIMFVILIISIIVVTKIILNKIHTHKIEKTTTLFDMNKSNINFVRVQGDLSISSNLIDLNSDIEQIEVNKETRQVLCVGNTNKTATKIQFTLSSNVNKFAIRVDPEVVTLKSGFACEFSVYVNPLCSCKINSTIQLVSKNLKTNEEKYNEIKIVGVTQQTTRIDYDELTEDEKLGEGSFGIVYKGNYRGNVVAIKKMKTVVDNDGSMDEFNKEVNMLDKFRSEYIIHFYGAVFIASKICMVTEFAQFGSLQNLMIHKIGEEVDMKLRVKIMIDAAKGVSYLHENGILHRDIKPDNILIFSLDLNEKVNAKLTDFGSSRNINLLMTNMTFTKGIGTPKYMAPEVLNQEKYKKGADIYSLAVTLYECATWKDIYPKDRFKFAWNIVDFVVSGKRLKKPPYLKDDIYNIVDDMWCQDVYKRIGISGVVTKLECIDTF
ncbi:protein serine/threonine kinase, putative [Entamoeba invadens IP1]|uniref:Protein serine/threonine kinase, putative n=1 Tax=Entamoeba invadens IP1 TaxID=370355 RepID=A0A0A1U9F7_ENTIV|nr:protein serine/threonine kinase, putative [Entamoeba invadens IP1]ELP91482.1 protein serine/threonine kinase, putative [Entamoeba invadens IP1]|eukprot:XP_004258253.1 protein serine/threonine kinase, putative [Entamoeba invadens IP1]